VKCETVQGVSGDMHCRRHDHHGRRELAGTESAGDAERPVSVVKTATTSSQTTLWRTRRRTTTSAV